VDIYHNLGEEAEQSKAKNKRRAAQALGIIEKWHKEASELALRHSSKLALSL
jgi:tRNA A37 N6-isopentenylltransferase MiaA